MLDLTLGRGIGAALPFTSLAIIAAENRWRSSLMGGSPCQPAHTACRHAAVGVTAQRYAPTEVRLSCRGRQLHFARLNHQAHLVQSCEVREWVAVDDEYIGREAGLQGAGLVADPDDLGG